MGDVLSKQIEGWTIQKNINKDIEISKMGKIDMPFWERSNVTSPSWGPH
jgi:hypothetical protein